MVWFGARDSMFCLRALTKLTLATSVVIGFSAGLSACGPEEGSDTSQTPGTIFGNWQAVQSDTVYGGKEKFVLTFNQDGKVFVSYPPTEKDGYHAQLMKHQGQYFMSEDTEKATSLDSYDPAEAEYYFQVDYDSDDDTLVVKSPNPTDESMRSDLYQRISEKHLKGQVRRYGERVARIHKNLKGNWKIKDIQVVDEGEGADPEAEPMIATKLRGFRFVQSVEFAADGKKMIIRGNGGASIETEYKVDPSYRYIDVVAPDRQTRQYLTRIYFPLGFHFKLDSSGNLHLEDDAFTYAALAHKLDDEKRDRIVFILERN